MNMPKLFITGLFCNKLDMLLLFKMSCNLHFNPFYNRSFFDGKDDRDPG